MRNISRWLLNRYSKQKELTRYKPSDYYEQWVMWPKHLTAPTKADMRFIERTIQSYEDEEISFIGKVMTPGGNIRIIYHPTFVWYFDGSNSITFTAILFPDGTEWRPYG